MLRKRSNHECAKKAPGYDAWFARQVRSSLREADRRPNDVIEHDEAVKVLDEAISRGLEKAGPVKSRITSSAYRD